MPIGALLSDAAALTFHRGITHALLMVPPAAILLGLAAARIHRAAGVGWRPWSLLLGAVLLSHLAIDAFTSYGIQLFLPLTDRAFAIASVSVIDPLYTLPLLLTVPVLVWLRRDRPARRYLATAGIALSTAYLGLTAVNKLGATRAFEAGLAQAGIEHQRLFVKPTVFNNVLWRGIAETDKGYHVGFHSRLDDAPPDNFVYFTRGEALLAPYRDAEVTEKLLRVSRGYYQVIEREGDLYFHDLRYGQGFEWLRDDRPHVFTYRLLPGPAPADLDVELVPHRKEDARPRETFRALLRRARGH